MLRSIRLRLPHVRLGRRILIPRQALYDWLDREAGATIGADGVDLSDRGEREVRTVGRLDTKADPVGHGSRSQSGRTGLADR